MTEKPVALPSQQDSGTLAAQLAMHEAIEKAPEHEMHVINGRRIDTWLDTHSGMFVSRFPSRLSSGPTREIAIESLLSALKREAEYTVALPSSPAPTERTKLMGRISREDFSDALRKAIGDPSRSRESVPSTPSPMQTILHCTCGSDFKPQCPDCHKLHELGVPSTPVETQIIGMDLARGKDITGYHCTACGDSAEPCAHFRSMMTLKEVREMATPVETASPEKYNAAYKFMHEWLKRVNPRCAENHQLKLRIRRNRLAGLLTEYGAELESQLTQARLQLKKASAELHMQERQHEGDGYTISDLGSKLQSAELELTQAREELAEERIAHGIIADLLLPLVGTSDGTTIGAARKAEAEITRLRSELAELKRICPVCGEKFRRPLEEHDICPCCHTHFGYTDTTTTHAELRAKWLGKAQEKVSRQRADLARCYQEIASLKSHLAFHHGAQEEIKRLTHILQSKDTK